MTSARWVPGPFLPKHAEWVRRLRRAGHGVLAEMHSRRGSADPEELAAHRAFVATAFRCAAIVVLYARAAGTADEACYAVRFSELVREAP